MFVFGLRWRQAPPLVFSRVLLDPIMKQRYLMNLNLLKCDLQLIYQPNLFIDVMATPSYVEDTRSPVQ